MRIQPRALGLVLSLLCLATTRAGWAAPSDEQSEQPYANVVTARLLAEHAQVRAGEPFLVGVEITMERGWHTYWENGGDAGLPTSIASELPDGWTAGEIPWPAPHRYEQADDLVTFGYADKTLLLTEITPSDDASESATLRARVDWLQCKDICIPGGADVEILVAVGETVEPANATIVRAFEASEALTPRSAAEHSVVRAFQDFDAIPVGGSGIVAAVLTGLGDVDLKGAEFFPRPSTELWFRDATFRSDGDNVALLVPVEVDTTVDPSDVPILSGVI
jgi:thiol:disulfide interchange protein DsbD